MQLEDYFEFEKFDAKFGVAERIRLKGTRVSIDTVVDGFNKGIAPQEIAEHCPSVTPEQVYAAITYYLHNKRMWTTTSGAARRSRRRTTKNIWSRGRSF